MPAAATDPAGHPLHHSLITLYTLFGSGNYTYQRLADELNAAGRQYRDRHGKYQPFTKEHTREILARWRLYRGDLPLSNVRHNSKNIEWVPGGHQPIIPPHLCNLVAARLQEHNRPYKARSTNRTYLLSNLLYCDDCGQPLIGQKAKGDHYYYRHANAKNACPQQWIPADAIEQQVVDALIEVLYHPSLIADITAGMESIANLSVPDQPAAPNTNRLLQLREQIDRLEDLYITGGMNRSNYLIKRARILSELAELENQSPSQPATIIQVEETTALLHFIANAERSTQRDLISLIFSRLTAAAGEIKTATPQNWALPFFELCERWAGWESTTGNTRPTLITWL